MKALFIVFHGFAAHNGISKKIFYQVNALKKCNVPTELCYMLADEDGCRKRMIDDNVLENYGKGFMGKINKRIKYNALYKYILQKNIQLVYVRHDHNANPFLIRFFRKLKKKGIVVFLEIPTYPYDQEYNKSKRKIYFDRKFRNILAKNTSRIVTFSDDEEIFGAPTINISNGIDFDQIKMKTNINDISRKINLLGVAEIHFWHGFDRVITGLAEYYKVPRDVKVFFHIVGKGGTKRIKELIRTHRLEEYVILHGAKSGEELDSFFELADMGIASLGRHRSNITKIKTLKNREYAARGIPFVYSEIDEDFENMPYIMKASPDDSPLDIEKIVQFRQSKEFIPADIRSSVIHDLSWTTQMQKIIDFAGKGISEKI